MIFRAIQTTPLTYEFVYYLLQGSLYLNENQEALGPGASWPTGNYGPTNAQ